MNRRTFLAGVTGGLAGLAGCAGLAAPDEPTATETPVPVPGGDDGTGSTPEGGPRDGTLPEPDGPASVVDLETAPLTYALVPTRYHTDDGADVRLWFDRTATPDHPARIRGVLRNGNEFPNTFRTEWLPVVGRRRGRQQRGRPEAQLWAIPTEGNELTDTPGAVSRTDEGVWYAADRGAVPETYRLDPGEHVRIAYHLVRREDTPDRPTGTYEFRGRDGTVRVTAWETDGPGPTTGSRFAGRTVPPLDREEEVLWYHDAGPSTAVFVRPEAERIDLDGSVTFTAVNRSHEPVRCGHWNLYKLVDGEWFHVGPTVHTSDCRGLRPGERKRWALRAFNGEPVGCGRDCGCDGLTRGHLGGGLYGVVAGYGAPADSSGALLELGGEPVTLSLTPGAAVSTSGEDVTVTTPRYGDGQRPEDATLTLRRADAATERLIPEQLLGDSTFGSGTGRFGALRNGLAAFGPDAERVEVRTDRRAVDRALGHDTRERRIRYEGRAYVASRASPER